MEGHLYATLMELGLGSGSLMSDPEPRRGGWRVQGHGPPGGSLPGLAITSYIRNKEFLLLASITTIRMTINLFTAFYLLPTCLFRISIT